MGIPKFYRWISERYPCLSEYVKENQIPEFDNLYLDMNGIIHCCSHPNDEDPHFRISEEQIFKDIFHYIEILFRIIRPKKLFFMAVDGVAPRAKMNQQRGRRFMSAHNAQLLADQAKKRGEKLPEEERFDSNCITPGTAFMVKLHEQLKYFVSMKITSDDLWRGISIYLSGHDVPGEGEHKIMDFIRYSRSQNDYDPNTRHCLYGLDADLIMLGMCSHEPHFSLLREEVKFVRPSKNQKGRTGNPDDTKFHLLHLSLMREYIDFEFSVLRDKLSFEYELEKIIDDWVLMGFLVGNDFIPHLPHLHIHESALPRVYNAYCCVLPTLDGYINENGQLNLVRFEKFLQVLSQLDRDHFGDEFSDLKWLEGKSRSAANTTDIRSMPNYKPKRKGAPPPAQAPTKTIADTVDVVAEASVSTKPERKELVAFDFDSADEADMENMDEDLKNLIKRSSELVVKPATAAESNANTTNTVTIEEDSDSECSSIYMEDLYKRIMGGGDDVEDEEEWTAELEKEFKQHKKNYYKEKLDYDKVTKEVLYDQAIKYVTAIQWNLHYYYDGCCSWSWFYPHHYSPYLSDVKGFAGLDLKFDLGEAFLPFQQLLAVLPAASRKLLPSCYQKLMTSAESPIIDFYPERFETDLNGKKQEWEAVVLIPFIQQDRLLKAMAAYNNSLTPDENFRNRHGDHLLFTTSDHPLGNFQSSLPGVFPDIEHNIASCVAVPKDTFRILRDKIVYGLLPGVKLDVYFPGFPTFKHIPVQHELKRIDVKVFQANSKNESIVLSVESRQEFQWPADTLASRLLGKEVLVNWPHMTSAIVYSLHSKDFQYVYGIDKTMSNEKVVRRVALTLSEKRQYVKDEEFLNNRYYQNRAVDVGKITFLVQVKPLLGKRIYCDSQGQIKVEKQFSDRPTSQILQTIVEKANVHDSVVQQYNSLEELFPIGCEVVLLSNPFYGHQGVVSSYETKSNKNKLLIKLSVPVEPDFVNVFEKEKHHKLYWFTGHHAADKLDVTNHFLSRITGTVYMEETRPGPVSPTSSTSSSNEKPVKVQQFADNKAGNNSRANRHHIGLNLKFSKKNEEVPDYTRKDSNGTWLYSSNVLRVLDEYEKKFPEIFDHLHNVSCSDDVYFADEIWKPPQDYKTKIKELSDFMKNLPCYNAQHQPAGTDTVDERMIKILEQEIEATKKSTEKPKKKNVVVNPKVLFRSCLITGNVAPDANVDYQLYDRVVNVRDGFTVPIGLRGTVVGVHVGQTENDTKLDVIFDDEFLGGLLLRGSKRSGYRVPAYALVNLSYGIRLEKSNENCVKQQRRVHRRQHEHQHEQENLHHPIVKHQHHESKSVAKKSTAFTPTVPPLSYDNPNHFVAQLEKPSVATYNRIHQQAPPPPNNFSTPGKTYVSSTHRQVFHNSTKQVPSQFCQPPPLQNVSMFSAENIPPAVAPPSVIPNVVPSWVPSVPPPLPVGFPILGPPQQQEQQKFLDDFMAKLQITAVDPVATVATQAPPQTAPPSSSAMSNERKYNGSEFIAKFAMPACVSAPPPSAIQLPVDPQSAFSQVQHVTKAPYPKILPNVVRGIFDATRKEERMKAWSNLVAVSQAPPPIQPQVVCTGYDFPRQPPIGNVWPNSNIFDRPPPPMRPATQQLSYYQHVPPPGAALPPPHFYFNSSAQQSASHNLFVPMQVTKKQPVPAYVKTGMHQMLISENIVQQANEHSASNNSVDKQRHEFRPINEPNLHSRGNGDKSGFVDTTTKVVNNTFQESVRPKSVNRTSRIAANFFNANK